MFVWLILSHLIINHDFCQSGSDESTDERDVIETQQVQIVQYLRGNVNPNDKESKSRLERGKMAPSSLQGSFDTLGNIQ